MAAEAPRWKVTGQQETVIAQPNGAPLPVVRVTFETASHVIGYVDVPRTDFSVDTVRTMVDDRAATLEAVATLTSN